MSDQKDTKNQSKKPLGEAIELKYGEGKDFIPTGEDIQAAQAFARRISPLALALFEARLWEGDTEMTEDLPTAANGG